MNVSFGFLNPLIDNYGHIGGLIFGFFLMFVIENPIEGEDGMCCSSTVWKIVSYVFLAVLYIGGLLLLFLVRKYTNEPLSERITN